jgi:DNA-binding NarL/FixJ family response regulator
VAEVVHGAGDRFAAKLLSGHRFSVTAEMEKRFQREIAALQQVQHPHLVRAEDRGVTKSGRSLLVMELLTGGSLDQRIRGRNGIDPELAVVWLRQILSGVNALHERGLVHRDITAKNVLFRQSGEAVVADFGTVRHLDDTTITSSRDHIGSLLYIPPEQFEDPHDVDTRADVFSIGQLAFYLFTGKFPFGNQPSLARVARVSQPVARLIYAMRAPERISRPANAGAVLESLDSAERQESLRSAERRNVGTRSMDHSRNFTAMVVDDHPLARESMVARLMAMGAREVLEAASVSEAHARAHAGGPRDLCVLDVALPDGSGLDLLADLRAAGWPRLVVLSAADDPYSVRAAFVAGAQGYLLKSASPLVVDDGLRRVLDGGVYADPSVASLLAAGLPGRPQQDGVSELSDREVEVLKLVADGRSNKEIGETLGLSALTVKSHLARVARKLGTGDRAEMVAMAMRAGAIGSSHS